MAMREMAEYRAEKLLKRQEIIKRQIVEIQSGKKYLITNTQELLPLVALENSWDPIAMSD